MFHTRRCEGFQDEPTRSELETRNNFQFRIVCFASLARTQTLSTASEGAVWPNTKAWGET